MLSKKKIFLYLAAIFLIACVLRIPSLLVNFVNIDENEVAMAGRIIVDGGIPYKDYLIYQPPLLYYFYALVIKLIPTPELNTALWWVHFVMLFYVGLTAIAIYALGKTVFDDSKKGLFAALFFAVFSTTFLPQDMLAANIELFMILPMTLAALFFLRRWYFIAGMFLGMTLLSKYQGGILLPVMVLYLFMRERWRSLLPILSVVVGMTAVVGLWIFYLYKNGALPDAIACFQYILHYAKGPAQNDWLYVSMKLLMKTFLIAFSGFGLWYFAFKGMRTASQRPALLCALWILLGFIPIVSGGRIYFHYYLIIYPPLAVLAGDQVILFFEKLRAFPFERVVWKTALFVLMMAAPVIGFTSYATYKPFRPMSVRDYWIYAVDYVRDTTQPTDSILVWGYCPQIYVMANRPFATRFTTSDYLTGRSPKTAGLEYDPNMANPPSPWRKLINDFQSPKEVVDYDTSSNIYPGGWELFMKDLAKNSPELIIDTAPSNYRMYGRYPIAKFPLLNAYVAQYYDFETTIFGTNIYRRKHKS